MFGQARPAIWYRDAAFLSAYREHGLPGRPCQFDRFDLAKAGDRGTEGEEQLGAVDVFVFGQTLAGFPQIVAGDGVAPMQFGCAVDLDQETLLVGASGHNDHVGAAIFRSVKVPAGGKRPS